jgi:hypothetical protein
VEGDVDDIPASTISNDHDQALLDPTVTVDQEDANMQADIDSDIHDGDAITEDLADAPIKPRFRTLIVMCACVMGICWLLYSAVGMAGFALFGYSTKANVIDSFGSGHKIIGGRGKDPFEPVTDMIIVCQLLMALSTILGYPTMVYISRQTLFELIGSAEYMSCRYVVTTAIIQILTLSLALGLRWMGLDISFVISLIGSTAGTTIQFILPACMLITLGMRKKGIIFMVFGITFGVLGTGMTIMSAVCDSKFKASGHVRVNGICDTLGFES